MRPKGISTTGFDSLRTHNRIFHFFVTFFLSFFPLTIRTLLKYDAAVGWGRFFLRALIAPFFRL